MQPRFQRAAAVLATALREHPRYDGRLRRTAAPSAVQPPLG